MTTKISSLDPGDARSHGSRCAPIVAVQESLVSINVSDTRVMKNEVGYVSLGDGGSRPRCFASRANVADMQVFEDTAGCQGRRPGRTDRRDALGRPRPGPAREGLSTGCRTRCPCLAEQYGFFLPRGVEVTARWTEEVANSHATVSARRPRGGRARLLGTVPEGIFEHKIMVPVRRPSAGGGHLDTEGSFTVDEPGRPDAPSDGSEIKDLTMLSAGRCGGRCPHACCAGAVAERLYPTEPLTTTSGSSTPSSRSRAAAPPASPVRSVPARRSCRASSPATRPSTSSSSSPAASARAKSSRPSPSTRRRKTRAPAAR